MPSSHWLLAGVPIALAVGYLAPERHVLVFVTSALAILPLAGTIGRATGVLADGSAAASAACSTRRSATPPSSSSARWRCAKAWSTS